MLQKISLVLIIFVSICSHGQSKDKINFMLGEWNLKAKITTQKGVIYGNGTKKVYYKESKDTLYAEMNVKFQNFNVVGTTKRVYNERSARWNIIWVTLENSKNPPKGEGNFRNGNFVEIFYDNDQLGSFLKRLVFLDISKDHFSVRMDRLYDNGVFMKDTWGYEAKRIKNDK